MLESKVQEKIINHLQKNGWFVIKIIRCNHPGFNDCEALKNGRAVFIEVKQKDKIAEPLQVFRHEQLQAQGFEAYTVDSFEEYLELKL